MHIFIIKIKIVRRTIPFLFFFGGGVKIMNKSHKKTIPSLILFYITELIA